MSEWATPHGRCATCGKGCFATKARAKAAIRQMRGRQGRLNVYRCGDVWHIGHLPREVIGGVKARQDIEPRESA